MPHVQTVLIIRGDKLSAEALSNVTRRTLPSSNIELATCAQDAARILGARPAELIITGLDPSVEGDVLGLVATLVAGSASARIIVIAGHEEPRLLAALSAMGVHAVFDAVNEEAARFEGVLAAVAAGGRCWSPSIWQRIWAYQGAVNSPAKALTGMEQMVLSIIGDGSDDCSAATLLGLRLATVTSVRRNLHRKLGVQHRGDLVRFAAQHGFVRFTAQGVVRPGFSLLAAACRSPKASRHPWSEPASA